MHAFYDSGEHKRIKIEPPYLIAFKPKNAVTLKLHPHVSLHVNGKTQTH